MAKTTEPLAWLEDEDVFSVPYPLPPEHAEVVKQPNRAAAAAAELEPCGATYAAVLGIRYDRVSDAGLLNLLEAAERHLAAMQARQVELPPPATPLSAGGPPMRRSPGVIRRESGSCATRRRSRSRPRRSPATCGSRPRSS